MVKNSALIYSGGLDSTTMLYEYAENIAVAINFSYGANHNRIERQCARFHCDRLGIELIEIELPFMSVHFSSSLLEGAEAIPGGKYDTSNMASTVVPFRNGIMLSIAAGIAESRGLEKVMIANHGGDHSIYPDCRPDFISAMSEAIRTGTYAGTTLLAPYTNLTKTEIALRGLRLGIDYSHTYSCYRGLDEPCGTCATCREREEALSKATELFNKVEK